MAAMPGAFCAEPLLSGEQEGPSKVVEMLREITTAQTYVTARKRMDEAIEVLEKLHPKVAQILEENGAHPDRLSASGVAAQV